MSATVSLRAATAATAPAGGSESIGGACAVAYLDLCVGPSVIRVQCVASWGAVIGSAGTAIWGVGVGGAQTRSESLSGIEIEISWQKRKSAWCHCPAEDSGDFCDGVLEW